jgi:hypothetical protein
LDNEKDRLEEKVDLLEGRMRGMQDKDREWERLVNKEMTNEQMNFLCIESLI